MKFDEFDYIKIKDVFLVKDIMEKVNRLIMEKLFVMFKIDEGLIFENIRDNFILIKIKIILLDKLIKDTKR